MSTIFLPQLSNDDDDDDKDYHMDGKAAAAIHEETKQNQLAPFKIVECKQLDRLQLWLKVQNTTRKHLNTLRQILIGKVPTMALSPEKSHCEFHSLPQGQCREVLVTYLQMLPFKVNPNWFEVMGMETTASLNNTNSLQFELYAEYPQQYDSKGNPKQYNPAHIPEQPVLAEAIRWIPYNDQQLQWMQQQMQKPSTYWETHSPFPYPVDQDEDTNYSSLVIKPHDPAHCIVRPAFEDYGITTLKPNEKLHATFTIIKGNDPIHKKRTWTPVATVSVLPTPLVSLTEPIVDIEDAKILIDACPKKIFSLADSTDIVGTATATPVNLVVLNHTDQCTMCQACTQTDSVAVSQSVSLQDHPNEFTFKIETRGGIPVHMLFLDACNVAIEHCRLFLQSLSELK